MIFIDLLVTVFYYYSGWFVAYEIIAFMNSNQTIMNVLHEY